MKPKLILLVEDDAVIRQLLWHYLEKEKYRLALAKDGEEGLEQAEAQKPDLIILDLMLPRRDGLSVLKQLRQRETTASIPVLILTAKGDEADRVVGLELGADDYVTKPFSPREVAARVKALLRRTLQWGRPRFGRTIVNIRESITAAPENFRGRFYLAPAGCYPEVLELVERKEGIKGRFPFTVFLSGAGWTNL